MEFFGQLPVYFSCGMKFSVHHGVNDEGNDGARYS